MAKRLAELWFAKWFMIIIYVMSSVSGRACSALPIHVGENWNPAKLFLLDRPRFQLSYMDYSSWKLLSQSKVMETQAQSMNKLVDLLVKREDDR